LIRVDDPRERARPREPSSMLRGIEGLVRRDIPTILLSHNPDIFPRQRRWASRVASRAAPTAASSA
jgi:predicted MPP superfamily phosphohydrolase